MSDEIRTMFLQAANILDPDWMIISYGGEGDRSRNLSTIETVRYLQCRSRINAIFWLPGFGYWLRRLEIAGDFSRRGRWHHFAIGSDDTIAIELFMGRR